MEQIEADGARNSDFRSDTSVGLTADERNKRLRSVGDTHSEETALQRINPEHTRFFMHVSGLVGALAPVFFVLVLGYVAGKRNEFDVDQSAGLSKLALNFALPASLFVSMTSIPKDLLLQQGRLLLALTIVHLGLFIAAWVILNLVKPLHGTASLIYALALSTSATPVFGFAVLQPISGATAGPTIGLVALTINLTVPLAVVLLAMDEATKRPQTGAGASSGSPLLTGLGAGLKSPLLWAPILGIIVTLSGHHLPM
jgi:malonate transporter and related proteins